MQIDYGVLKIRTVEMAWMFGRPSPPIYTDLVIPGRLMLFGEQEVVISETPVAAAISWRHRSRGRKCLERS